MATLQVILDTDTLSAIMRKNSVVIPKAHAYLAAYSRFKISIITRYEILRGLKAKDATKQETTFNRFCAKNLILPLTDEVIVKAAEIYATLHQQGNLIGDADILIAASALVHGLGIVTNNEKHFRRITDLQVENWFRQ
ncbi:type II toxin-antitoxin system VapC family toxin [Patescibacteria group bacterium]|nr:type II toxin-antitoxin system VapC family toxin [Patescibacteria group bacterium]